MDELELGRTLERMSQRIEALEMRPYAAVDHVHDTAAFDALSSSVAPLLQQAADAAAQAEALAAEAAALAETPEDAEAATDVSTAAGEVADEADEAAADAAPVRVHPLGRTLGSA